MKVLKTNLTYSCCLHDDPEQPSFLLSTLALKWPNQLPGGEYIATMNVSLKLLEYRVAIVAMPRPKYFVPFHTSCVKCPIDFPFVDLAVWKL